MLTGWSQARRSTPARRWPVYAAILILAFLYWVLSLDQLALFPPVGEDEPWLAATSFKLATEGVYGNDLFAGYYGRERHDYNHLPVYLLLQAMVFKGAGVGVFQMRFLPVACGLLLLALTFTLARQVGGDAAAVVAVLLLVGQRLALHEPQVGIPLLDIARVSRYDILVPVFGLSAFCLFNRAERQRNGGLYLLVGFLVGLASLTHLYGLFWLPSLGLVLLWRRGWQNLLQPAPYLLLTGAALPWLPWLAFVASGWEDYLGQMRFVADRFDLLDPAFYLDNLRYELQRWHLDLLAGGLRPGAWLAIAGLPLAVLLLLARGRSAPESPRFALGVATSGHLLLFAALLKVKLYNYGIALWPLAVVALAWLGVGLWARMRGWLGRGLLALLLLLLLVDGGVRLIERRTVARQVKSYAEFEARVAAYIPPGARVLGLQHYWLGLRHFPYRTWLVPLLQAHPLYYHQAMTLDQALNQVAPDVVLIDRHIDRYFDELVDPGHDQHRLLSQFEAFMEQHRALLVGQVWDSTYGLMRIYTLDGTSPPAGGP
jgi:4-amino-4-deoxy-L-arabinose transferase-like glycosyltransferase